MAAKYIYTSNILKEKDKDYGTSEKDKEVKDEPGIENDYGSHPEIEAPNPSTATPSIPAEMPAR